MTTKRATARPPKSTHTRRTTRCCKCNSPEASRRYIGLAIVALIATSAVIGMWTPAALTVLERLLPALTLMCGYYYGR